MKLAKLSIISLLLIPVAYAGDCGITNLASCIPEKLYEFMMNVINAPIKPLLSLTKALLSEPVSTGGFSYLWAIIVYIISLFYGLFFLFAGFNFLISGFDIERKEKAKIWLKNTLLMVLFVQASYLLYSAILEIAALLSAGVLDMIKQEFFLLTVDNLINVGLQFFFGFFYVTSLVLTIIMLGVRYLIVAVGVVLFPIGLFLYFIPPLRSYGKLVLNVLFVIIFLPFFQAIILLCGSMLLQIPVFANLKILVMIASFTLVNLLTLLLLVFAIVKSAFSFMHSDFGRAATMAVKYFG